MITFLLSSSAIAFASFIIGTSWTRSSCSSNSSVTWTPLAHFILNYTYIQVTEDLQGYNTLSYCTHPNFTLLYLLKQTFRFATSFIHVEPRILRNFLLCHIKSYFVYHFTIFCGFVKLNWVVQDKQIAWSKHYSAIKSTVSIELMWWLSISHLVHFLLIQKTDLIFCFVLWIRMKIIQEVWALLL